MRCCWRYSSASRAAGIGVDDRRRTPSILRYFVRLKPSELVIYLNLLKGEGEVGYAAHLRCGLEASPLPL